MRNKNTSIEASRLEFTVWLLRRVKCDNFKVVGPAKRRLAAIFQDGKGKGDLVALNTKER